MLRTVCVAAVALAAVMFGEARAQPAAEATDRLTEGVMMVQHQSIAATATGEGSGQFMLPNPGNLTALVVGCEDHCRSMQVQVRAAGLAPIRATAPENDPSLVVLQLPEAYSNAMSNFEVSITLRCNFARQCVHRWAALAKGEPRAATPSLSAAEWDSAATQVSLSSVRWRQRPTGEDLRFYYPVDAWRTGMSGSARLECVIVAGGALRCRAAGENPPASGFGESARLLSSLLRVEETGEDGASVVGKRIVVPIRFEPAASS